MLGWFIIVSAPGPQADEAVDGAGSRVVLATWETGLFGADWIMELAASGKAEQLSFDGYPNRFTVRAGEVLPLFDGDAIPGARPDVRVWSHELHPDLIAACPADRTLTVDVWDQS
ncbi:hypothetical protein ACFVYP_38630 [Kitasatospora sp. NPDC058201]|uniref:hypothetical protein n=1 Tax=unclassified Kitasatospora TaxID=2633591 RepID=UPI00364DBF7E